MAEKYSASEAGIDHDRLQVFAASLHREDTENLTLNVRPLRGGMRAGSVAHVSAKLGSTPGTQFVVKRLSDHNRREAALYKALGEHGGEWLAPRLLGLEQLKGLQSYLYLENVRPWRRWPWRNVETVRMVLESLAWIHSNLPAKEPFLNTKYEVELLESATATIEMFEEAVRVRNLASLGRFGNSLRRMVSRLAEIRCILLSTEAVVLHGDVHPGNVLMRWRLGGLQPVLLDWENMRVGSPLEDVSSWLQSIAYWEPQARRRHDTLLRQYLAARGLTTELTRELRERYWLAAACNALAGALRYHLWAAYWMDCSPKQKAISAHAARDWLRMIRRADECLKL